MPSATDSASTCVDAECPICGGPAQLISFGIVAPFLTELLSLPVGSTTRYCQCNPCAFAFFDLRYGDDQMSLIYSDYRGSDYF